MLNKVPIIDISILLDEDRSKWLNVINAIDYACKNTGFFYITHHGINPDLIIQVLKLAEQFFKQDDKTKNKNLRTQNKYHLGYSPVGAENLELDISTIDNKESFDISPDLSNNDFSLLPNLPNFSSIMLNYYNQMFNVSMRLLEAMALALGEKNNSFTKDFIPTSGIMLRLNHYPPCSANQKNKIIAGAHTDYGYLTLLYQDDIGGLQICDANDDWVDVSYIENSFVVNIGDLMQRLTNDIYKSTMHRVLLKQSHKSRFSIPYFVEPNYNTIIKCLPSCLASTKVARYEPVISGDWITEKLRKTYGDIQVT